MFINNSYPRKSYINETTINKIVTKINLGLELSTEEEYQILDYSITKCWETMEKYFNIEIKTNTLTNKCDYAQKNFRNIFRKNRNNSLSKRNWNNYNASRNWTLFFGS